MDKRFLIPILFLLSIAAASACINEYGQECNCGPIPVGGFALGPAYDAGQKIDPNSLPTSSIYDPFNNRNVVITSLSYDEINSMMGIAGFNRWNNVQDVCESMQILFGKTSPYCASYVPPQIVNSATARAYVMFRIAEQPQVITPATPRYIDTPNGPSRILIVDPVYPPWSPTYNYWY